MMNTLQRNGAIDTAKAKGHPVDNPGLAQDGYGCAGRAGCLLRIGVFRGT